MSKDARHQKKNLPGQRSVKSTTPDLRSGPEDWCRRNRNRILPGIILLSLLIRGVYFSEINSTHLINQHRWNESDMFVFDEWAMTVAKGDILSRAYTQQEHIWMKETAQQFFKDHPDQLKAYREKLGNDTINNSVSKMLWKHWYGENIFPHEPLYGYFLAINYTLFGHNVRWVFLWQLLLGVVTNVLIYLVTRRYFGDLAGVVAALLAVFCGPMLLYEMVLLRSSFACFFGILVVYLTGKALQKNSFLWWLISGITCGLAIMVHGFFILFALCWIVFLLITYRHLIHILLISISGFLFGTLIAISPVMIRNTIVGAPLMSMSNNSAVGFINMNNDTFESYRGWMYNTKYTSDILAESDGKFLKTIIPTLKTHKSISGYLSQVWEKFHATFSWFEIPNNVNYYFYREFSAALKVAFVTFLILSPLAIIGIFLSFYRKRYSWSLYITIAVFLVPMLAFMVLGRYRIIFAPVLIPFAALTVAELLSPWKGWKNILIVTGLLILGYWSSFPGTDRVQRIEEKEYRIVFITHYYDQIIKEENAKNWDGVIYLSEDFLSNYEPSYIRQLPQNYRCKNETEAGIFRFFANIHNTRAETFQRKGDVSGSVQDATIAEKLTRATGLSNY